MPAYAPQTLSLSLAGSTTPAAWTHWSGNPLTFSVSLTGSTDFTSCTLLRVELHTRRDSAEDGDSLLEYVEEANPASEPTALTFTGAQLNGLIADGSTSRRLWVCVVGYVDGSKYTFGSGWLTLLRDNYSGDSDTAHTPADNNFVTESQLDALAAVLYTSQTLTSDQQTQARTNISAAKSGAVTGSGLTMATARLLGRTTASSGAIEEISIGSGLTLSAGSLSSSVDLSGYLPLAGGTMTGTLTIGGSGPDFYGLALVPGTGTMTVSRATLGNTEYAQVSPTLIRLAGSVDSAGLDLYRGGLEIVNTSGFGAIIGSSLLTADRIFAFPDTAGTMMVGANNLSEVSSAATARSNLGLSSLATTTPGAGVATFLATPSSANLAAAVTDKTGTGAVVFATSPTLVAPILGTPTSGTLTNCTIPASGISTGIISDDRLYPLRPSSFAGTYDDDFTGSSLDAKWSRQGLVSGDHTYQTGGGSWMSMNLPANVYGAIARLIHQPWTSTTNATLTCRIIHHQVGSAYPMFGPFFTDNSGNGIGVTLYNNTTGIIISTLSGWVYSSGALSVVYNIPNYNLLTPPTGLWMKLRKASTTYYASFSVDGLFWGPEISGANATAMTRVGLGMFLRASGGADYGAQMHFDFFKIT